MKKSIFIVILMSIFSNLSGLGAQPAKPDFAFPKTVSKNAEADLKTALHAKNGPATLNALIRYSLAQTAINPDDTEKVSEYLQKTSAKVSDPATKAMIRLLEAEMTHDSNMALEVWQQQADALKSQPVEDWKEVVVAQPQFFPTLYDFAAVKAPFDSVSLAMSEFYAERPLPRLYWLIGGGFSSRETLLKNYQQMKSYPESAYMLADLLNKGSQPREYAELYGLMQEWIALHGSSPYRSDVDNMVKHICYPMLSVESADVIAKGKTLKVKVTATCLNAGTLRIQQVKGTGARSESIKLNFEGTGYFNADTTLELRFDNYGVYRLTPEFDGLDKKDRSSYCEVTVTDLLLWRETFGSKTFNYALDALNGALQTDVEIAEVDRRLHGYRGADRFTPSLWAGKRYDYRQGERLYARVFTDRGIYHPGDSLRFAATIIELKGRNSSLVAGRKVDAILYNANHKAVDTLSLTSDNFGRVNGQFLLPSDGLTGNFSVEIPRLGSAYVTVTDYKAPTFEVKVDCERISATLIRVSGEAIGFNGFPISDAEVDILVDQLPRWVWFRNFRNEVEKDITSATARTGADGRFSLDLEIPDCSDESLSVRAIAASPTGETQEDFAFVPAKPYYISAEIPTYLERSQAPTIRALDAKGNEAKIPLRVELISQAYSAVVIADSTWTNVPSGLYNVKITAENDSLAFPYTQNSVYVYGLKDKMPPAEMSLFVPQRKVAPGDKLLVGTSFADSHILKTIWTDERILSQEWLAPAQGNMQMKVELPDSVKSAKITLMTLRNYQTEVVYIDVERPDILWSLNLKFSSFRDRMVPGERERWTISVADNLGQPAEAAVMLDVYSKALDAIMPFGWSFNLIHPGGNHLNLDYWFTRDISASNAKYFYIKKPLRISVPTFELYGRSWSFIMALEYQNVAFGSASVMMMEPDIAVVRELKSAPTAASGAFGDFASADTSEAEMYDEGAENGAAAPVQLEEYRLPEVAVALWAPALTTAPDGSLQVEFEAPNANTTWKVMCQAYDRRLLTGSSVAEIVAAKPLMVQPNVPRFLHVGDRTELRAMIMNASDSALQAAAFIETFDPLTGEIFARQDFDCTLAPGASQTVAMPLQAPDRSMLGVRVKASNDNFSDGEQTVIALLPAVITARSAKPLFFAADSTAIEFEAPRGSVVQLTTNAAWECVTALPGLAASESKSAFAATSALFSAAVGRGLVRTYPQIASALAKWQQEDSVLISKLSKNEDLKIALLSQTPWPAAAQSDSERMARLLLLLDRKEADRVIDGAIENLAKLVRKGGLGWTPDSEEASQWVTEEFLMQMAQLRRLGYLPASSKLQRIISGALDYLDREVARDYAKYKGEYPDYAELRPQFPEVAQSAPARRAQAHTVQYLISHWRDLGFTGQAQAALILHANGYQKTARTILESLRQYEAWRQTGLNAELLNAFAAIEPEAAEVDLIRQFFIERKQAMEWGDGPQTSNLIAAILSSGSNWLVPAENQMSLKVNGQEVKPEAEAMLGSFRLDLSQGGKVELTKGEFPAWGGIFTSLTDSVTEIPAFESEKLKITRRLEGELTVGSKVKLILEIDATQPLDYVIVKSPRAAMFSVVNQLPGRMWLPGSSVYREPCSTLTNWFFSRLMKGKTTIEEEFYITSEGDFLLPPAEAQSQYAPEFHSHTEGNEIKNEK